MGEFLLVGIVMILGMGAYWALVLYPRQRSFSKRQKLVQALEIGQEVITYGGFIGRIVSVDADKGTSMVELADGVTVKMINAAVMQVYDEEQIAANAQKALQLDIVKDVESQETDLQPVSAKHG